MRLEDLAARLLLVEAKLSTLTGTTVNTENATSIDQLDTRLSIVEIQVSQLITEKAQSHINDIISAPADQSPVLAENVVILSASFSVAEAADIVEDVVQMQIESPEIEHSEVAAVVSAAVAAVVSAEPEVVTNPDAITVAITTAITEAPALDLELHEQATDAIVQIISAAIGDEVSPEVQQQVSKALATESDPALDAIEARLTVAEAKVDSLLGK